MTDTEARLERLQADVDEARDMLRLAGVTGFGSITEGVAMLCAGRFGGKLDVCVTDEELASMDARQRSMQARLRWDDDFRLQLPLRLETMNILLGTLADAQGMHAGVMLSAAHQTERSLAHLLRELREKAHHE